MQFGISEAVSHWGRYHPDDIALTSNEISYTYRELDQDVTRFAQNLSTLTRFTPGTKVALAISPKRLHLIAFLGVLRSGGVPVFLNTGLTSDIVTHNIVESEARLLVYCEGALTSNLLSTGNAFGVNVETLLHNTANSTSADYCCDPENEWGVLFSSGSTGVPKGISRDHYSMVTELVGWCLELSINRKTIFYVSCPLYYTGGIVLTSSTLLAGGHVILNDYKHENDREGIWQDFQATMKFHDVDWAFFVPAQIRVFIGIARAQGSLPLNAKSILVMGAPISGEEKLSIKHVLGSDVVESWGNSESLGTITSPEDLYLRPDSVGRPFISDELFIVDANGSKLAANRVGKIAGGQEAGFSHYCNKRCETDRVKAHDYIISDDIGYMDEDGYFYVKGRAHDLVEVEGRSLFLPDIEELVRSKFKISELAISLLVSPDGCKTICCAIVSQDLEREHLHAAELQISQHLNVHKNSIKLTILDNIPYLPTGKLDRIRLAESLKEATEWDVK